MQRENLCTLCFHTEAPLCLRLTSGNLFHKGNNKTVIDMSNTNNHATGNGARQTNVRSPLFRELNPASQSDFWNNAQVLEQHPIGLPSEYFSFNSAETSTLISMILDSNTLRLNRILDRAEIRAMFRDNRYYQVVDDPKLYCRSRCFDRPIFHNRVVLYLTASGLLMYLKQTQALTVLSRFRCKDVQPKTTLSDNEPRQNPFFNVYAYQYATYVHCHLGDILRFQLDYLMFRLGYLDAVPILLGLGWMPNSPSMLLYRRRSYQYRIRFLDWVDLMCSLMRETPTASVGGFYDRLLVDGADVVNVHDLKYLGRDTLECMELRRLSKANCQAEQLWGLYAGRKILRDKETQCPPDSDRVFKQSQDTVRPMLPHACSVLRRLLIHLNYHDRAAMHSLPQLVGLIGRLLNTEFFAPHPALPSASLWREPLLFQIYDFVWSIRGGRPSHGGKPRYLRNESWDSIRSSEDAYAWYLRWDVFNCICLMFDILQNAIFSEQNEDIVDRLMRQLIDVLYSSRFLESFVAYSFFDVHLALISAVNCVPNIQHCVLLRVVKETPIHLTANLKPDSIVDSFSDRFWSDVGNEFRRPQTMEEIRAFFINRRRRRCALRWPCTDESADNSDMGSRGFGNIFQRNYTLMELVTDADEATIINNDPLYKRQLADDERRHQTEFKQLEADYRSSLWQLIDQQ